MIAHQFCKYFSKRKDVSHDVYFCDMKAKDFIEILSNTGYSVYIKRNDWILWTNPARRNLLV